MTQKTPNDNTSPEPVAASDIVADARQWLAGLGGERLQTHSENCHQWHTACLVGKLIREVELQRSCTAAGRDEIARLRELVSLWEGCADQTVRTFGNCIRPQYQENLRQAAEEFLRNPQPIN
jgi:hypothetical protein